MVSSCGKAAVPNDDDYNFDPWTDEFYQPEGLDGQFEIDISALMSMEVDNDVDEDEGDDVLDAKDLQLLEQWQRKREGVVMHDDDDDGNGDDEDDRELDNIDSDDKEMWFECNETAKKNPSFADSFDHSCRQSCVLFADSRCLPTALAGALPTARSTWLSAN